MQYLALLRGINVGGNNKVAMSELRECFEEAGFSDVTTYINSGNVLFTTEETNEVALAALCEATIKKQFGFNVIVMVIASTDFAVALHNAPSWWGSEDKRIRSDALFVIPPVTTTEVIAALKLKEQTPDQLSEYGQVIFWSLPMDRYSKSVVPKIIGTPIYRSITIRNSRTVHKLRALISYVRVVVEE